MLRKTFVLSNVGQLCSFSYSASLEIIYCSRLRQGLLSFCPWRQCKPRIVCVFLVVHQVSLFCFNKLYSLSYWIRALFLPPPGPPTRLRDRISKMRFLHKHVCHAQSSIFFWMALKLTSLAIAPLVSGRTRAPVTSTNIGARSSVPTGVGVTPIDFTGKIKQRIRFFFSYSRSLRQSKLRDK